MQLLSNVFALDKTPQQLAREAEERAEEEGRRRRSARGSIPPSAPPAAAHPDAAADGPRAPPPAAVLPDRPPDARRPFNIPTAATTPVGPRDWEAAYQAALRRVEEQAEEIATLREELRDTAARAAALEAAAEPLHDPVECQVEMDTLRVELARERHRHKQALLDCEQRLRLAFDHELEDLRGAHREELAAVRRSMEVQVAELEAHHERLLAENGARMDSLRRHGRPAANGTSRLSTVPPGESPTAAPLPPPESWEAAMIQESRRHSRRRYGALGLDEPTLGPERDAMQVYLKNVVVNLLCEPDDAVKATLIPTLAELLNLSASETAFVYQCHPEWRPGLTAPRPRTVWGALFGT